ncbi:MAG: DUF2577 domain-containing protein [Clostridiales bacterium]|uniref:DUF2577 domain-containing protein n=1 Tax=Zhenhengia sp. TaxID=2944208 RepID=UPI002906370D|nr:DUF2577 domain-containing protein [Clostridiales bacterium]
MIIIKNPYTGLLNIIQEQGKKYSIPAICIGKVVNTQPLQVKTGELILEQDELLVSDLLLSGYKRHAEIVSSGELTSSTQATSGGTGEASFATHNHKISASYNLSGRAEVVFESNLKNGDLVALLATENRQMYIVLCKVVKP